MAKSKKPSKPAKPSKAKASGVQLLADATAVADPPILSLAGNLARIARPTITTPTANSAVTAATDLGVSASVNLGNLRYKIELTDISGAPPFPAPFVIDATAVGASMVTGVIPAAQLPAGKTFRLRIFVHPDDGTTPPHLDHVITITT